jgi:hypothetical protein
MPPSTISSDPVMKEESSLARNRAALAISLASRNDEAGNLILDGRLQFTVKNAAQSSPYGGTLITHAGTDAWVAALVYIAALAPDADETSPSLLGKFPTFDVPEGRIWLKQSGVKHFAQYFCYIHPHMVGSIVVESTTGSNATK